MKKAIAIITVLLAFTMNVSAQVEEPKDTPQLEFVMQLKVTLGETYSCGETQHGRRTVIPITGGTFEGPNIKGTILNGGADYQLASGGRTEVEAIYSIKTDDGVYIHIRNRGIIASSKDAQGNPSFYFRCAPQFEAPNDSKYAWLNNSLFLCAPSFSQGFQGIVLNVWRVK
jgi:hypothetical protein